MNRNKIFLLLIAALLMISTNLIANYLFESTLTTKEIDPKGNEIFINKNLKVTLYENKINEDIKYKNIITSILKRAKSIEESSDESFIVEDIKDDKGNIWTVTITKKADDITVTHFISKQKEKTVEGWINRDNKDIFGLRIFNF